MMTIVEEIRSLTNLNHREMVQGLQGFAEHQPVSITASAVRALAIGGPTADYVWQSLAWIAGIIVVAAPLAVRRYRRAV